MTAVSERRDAPSAGVPGSQDGSPPRANPSAILALIAAGAAATLLLWWHGTPSLHGFGDWLTNAGRITGLEAGYGVVVLVALMARIPRLSAASARTASPAGTRRAAATRSASW